MLRVLSRNSFELRLERALACSGSFSQNSFELRLERAIACSMFAS